MNPRRRAGPGFAAGWDLLTPWRVGGVERRRVARIPLNIQPLQAIRVAGTQRLAIGVVIRNISTGGVLVRTEQELVAGQHLELTLGQPGGAVALVVRVDVRHARQIQEGLVEAWEAGCEFCESPRIDRKRLVGYILDQARASAA